VIAPSTFLFADYWKPISDQPYFDQSHQGRGFWITVSWMSPITSINQSFNKMDGGIFENEKGRRVGFGVGGRRGVGGLLFG
jgi:hypothetical protein